MRASRRRERSSAHARHGITLALPVARAIALTTAAAALTGCLPALIGSARVLHPGEFTVAAAGQTRTGALPAGVRQGGAASAVLEGRMGLTGGVLESGVALLIPWHAAWDAKVALMPEAGRLPAVALRGHLGLVQPSFGGNLLVTKSFGPWAATATAGAGQTSERLWPDGAGPFSSRAETFYKTVTSLGLGLEYQVSPVRALLLNLVTWDAADEHEATRADLRPLGAREGRTWYLTAGMRMRWAPPIRRRDVVLTALRGTVLTTPSEGRFTVGQPGLYQAEVLMDVHTQVTFAGASAPLNGLTLGRAVLIQGLPLPQPHTFLARTIELQ